jgi:hypothetical protein
MNKPRQSRWRKILWYLGLLIACFIFLDILLANWILNTPYMRQYLESVVDDQVPCKVQWKSVLWRGLDSITLYDVTLSEFPSDFPSRVSVGSIAVKSLLRGNRTIDLRHVKVHSTENGLDEIKRISITQKTENQQTAYIASLYGETIDADKYLDFFNAIPAYQQTDTPSMSFGIGGLFEELSIKSSYLNNTVLGKGQVFFENNDLNFNVIIEPNTPNQYRNQTIALEGRSVNSNENAQVSIEFKEFPLSYTKPVATSCVLNGTGVLSNWNQVDTNVEIQNLQLSDEQIDCSEISNIQFISDIHLASDIHQSTGSISIFHSPIHVDHPSVGTILAPTGTVSISRNENDVGVSGAWTLNDLGTLKIVADEMIDYPTASFDFHLTSEKMSLHQLNPYISSFKPNGIPEIACNLFVDVMGRIHNTELESIDGNMELSDLQMNLSEIRVHDCNTNIQLKGTGSDFQLNAPAEFQYTYTYGEETQFTSTIALESQININALKPAISVQIPVIQSELIQSASAWWNSDWTGALEGSISLENTIPKLRSIFLPPLWHELEGMGELGVDFQMNQDAYTVQLTSDDCAVYSLSDNLDFGIQLRDFTSDSKLIDLHSNWKFQSNIQASTPYLSCFGFEREWNHDTINIQSEYTNAGDASVRVIPPGGSGEADFTLNAKQAKVSVTDISLKGLILPILESLLGYESSTLDSLLSVQGNLSSVIDILNLQKNITADGEAQLKCPRIEMLSAPHLSFTNANISVPLFYPVTNKFSEPKWITVSSEKVRWDGASYPNASFDISIEPNTIYLAKDSILPVFGGDVHLIDVSLHDWIGQYPALRGTIELTRLKLNQVSQYSKLLPETGLLSGYIGGIEYENDRFHVYGKLDLSIFGGKIKVKNITLRPFVGGSKIVGFSMDITNLDLAQLVEYSNFGDMTGQISGSMKNVEIYVPEVGSDDTLLPVRFEMTVQSDNKKTATISRETLEKIVDLGESNIPMKDLNRSSFDYAQVGLYASLEGDRLKVHGTLPDYHFISKSQGLFTNTIGIRFPDSSKTMSFEYFWNKLIAIMKSFSHE